MAGVSVFSNTFLPKHAVVLGRFVLDMDDPRQDFHDPNDVVVPESMRSVTALEKYNGYYSAEVDRTLKAKLSALVSASRSKRSKSTVFVKTSKVRSYKLCNSNSRYEVAVTSEGTRV